MDLGHAGSPERNETVAWADRLMVRYEAWRLANNSDMHDRPGYHIPTEEEIELVGKWAPWGWKKSEEAFIVAARGLGYEV